MNGDLKHLLIVDDDAAIRGFFQEIFPKDRYRVDCASNGEEAARRIARKSYDVVVTDLCMPKMDGIGLIQEIQRIDATVTVVAITGFGTIKDAVSLMKTGAFDVLTKPFSLDEIRVTIDKAIRHHDLAKENRELGRRLETSEKLAAIGQLAAGVAHEINNPLDGIMRFVNLTLERIEDDEARGNLTDAQAGLSRIGGIVKDLLSFARCIGSDAEPQALDALIGEAVKPFEAAMRDRSIEFETRIAGGDAPIPGAVLHVVSNLAKNAIDALDSGGHLSIDATVDGAHASIDVVDDGSGIPADALAHIFEPFYTTKRLGHGTGLGLSLCQQIVEKAGGTIDVESSEDGTRFSVRVPLVEAPTPATV